jgi:thiamine kinase-like enzyme
MTEIDAALERLPWLGDAGTPTRLAGLTNINYRIGEFVLRLPGRGTADYIDRSAEEVAARAAAAAGVNAEVVFFDRADGLMVTRFVDGAITMTPARFTADLDAASRAGRVLHRLHTTSAPFASAFDLFGGIDEYKQILATEAAPLPDGYEEVEAEAERARATLSDQSVTLVPSHCDPLCENFLDTGDSMYLIDYEYAGNNDPMWDLGDLSVEAGFTPAQEELMLSAYFGGPAPAADAARMVVHKALCDLLWSLWGLVQHVNDNPVEDFWAYGVGRFERCKALMESTEYTDSMRTLGA